MGKKGSNNAKTAGAESEKAMGRRSFLKGVGVTTGALVGGGIFTVSAAGIQAAPEPVDWDCDVDVVVAGSGNGGMSAALAATNGGASTLLIEISTVIGGNTLMSGGIMHTAGQRTWEDYNRYTQGHHDQVLGRAYVETFWNEYIPWLQEQGAYMSRPNPEAEGWPGDWYLGNGEPGQLRHKLYFDSLVDAFEAKGGQRLMKTRVTRLFTDADGRVIGVQARTWNGSPREDNQTIVNVRAKKTILATGGWIMDGEREQRYYGQDGHMAQHLCGPFSAGEGLDMALGAGAALSHSGWPTFSGVYCAVTAEPQLSADPDQMVRLWEEVPPEDWAAPYGRGRLSPPLWVAPTVTTWGGFSPGIFVNNHGKRFVDESSTVHSRYARAEVAAIRQPGGYVWMIGDQEIHDAVPGSEAMIQQIIDEGGVLGTHGNVIIADSLEEFAEALSAAGVYKGAFLQTIEEYNRAVDEGRQEELAVPHSSEHNSGGYAIRTPPFYAVPVTVTPYMTYGGLRINQHGQALDAQGVPVPNLYAAPPLAGGIQNEVYTGAIACAGTFGYLAGKHASETLT